MGTNDQNIDSTDQAPSISFWSRIKRGIKRISILVIGFVGFYLLLSLIGLIPVNSDFKSSATDQGVEVAILSSAVHADIVLPINQSDFDWRDHFSDDCFSGKTSHCTHVAMGWGDRGFYVETPTWSDLSVGTSLNALAVPSETVMRVSMTKLNYLPKDGYRTVRISEVQYQRLCQFVLSSFTLDDDGSMKIVPDKSYGAADAFFLAKGQYHLFNTCNCWVGRAMKASGIKVGWFTPLPKSMFIYLPDE